MYRCCHDRLHPLAVQQHVCTSFCHVRERIGCLQVSNYCLTYNFIEQLTVIKIMHDKAVSDFLVEAKIRCVFEISISSVECKGDDLAILRCQVIDLNKVHGVSKHRKERYHFIADTFRVLVSVLNVRDEVCR